MLQKVVIINGQKKLVPLSGSTPTNEVALNNMQSVTSNAVAEKLNDVSEVIEIVNDAYAYISIRKFLRIVIIDVYAKTSQSYDYNLTPYNILSIGNGNKTPLTWANTLKGEAYINSLGQVHIDSSDVCSGQIVAFLA